MPVGVPGLHSLESAIQAILTRLCAGFSFPAEPINRNHVKKSERNAQIRAWYSNGEALSDLAREFELSPQRVFQIVRQ